MRAIQPIENGAFVYANFVTSLDGRIAIPHPTKSGMIVPEQIANPRDWRLFQELAIQADVLITSGRYLRDYADGRAQEILRVYDDPQFADLKEWRVEQGLNPLPDLAVISGSLNFPIPPVLTQGDRAVLIITTRNANAERVQHLRAQTGTIILAGDNGVDGRLMVDQLSDLGYRTIYSAAGPRILHLLLSAGTVKRLYLTLTNRILGGTPFSSIVEGDLFSPPIDFSMNSLYYDADSLDGLGQLFISYQQTGGRKAS